jgi:hypothetical protein
MNTVADACGLMNLMVAYFDCVVDEEPGGFELIRERFSRDTLRKALDPEYPASSPVFSLQPDEKGLVTFVITVADRLFSLCRMLGSERRDLKAWCKFSECVLEAYDGLLHTAKIGMSQNEARLLLDNSIKAAQMMARLVLLSPDCREDVDAEDVTRMMGIVGRVFGLVDELADLPRDLEAGRLNALLADSEAPPVAELSLLTTSRAVGQLLQLGVLDRMAYAIADAVSSITVEAEKLLPRPDRFMEQLRCWLSGWLMGVQACHTKVQIDVTESISRGIAFLEQQQEPSGEFMTEMSVNRSMASPQIQHSVYIHAYIMYSLASLPHSLPGVRRILTRASAFLRTQQEPDGWWRFYGHFLHDPPPDVDDTSVALAALIVSNTDTKAGDEAHRWITSLYKLRTEGGLYKTWRDPDYNAAGFQLPDAVVNANVLLLEGLVGVEDTALVHFFLKTIHLDRYEYLNTYGVTNLVLPYLISRCFSQGHVKGLEVGMDRLAEFVVGLQHKDGSWGSGLDTALALLTFLNISQQDDYLGLAALTLLEHQEESGRWCAGAFFRDISGGSYSSSALSTALCIEALSRLDAQHSLTNLQFEVQDDSP